MSRKLSEYVCIFQSPILNSHAGINNYITMSVHIQMLVAHIMSLLVKLKLGHPDRIQVYLFAPVTQAAL